MSAEADAFDVDLSPTRAVLPPTTEGSAEKTEVVAPGFEPFHLGRYMVRQLIGKGGMAEVYLATQDGPAGFEKTCVVKRMRRALVDEQRFVDMFLREAKIAARLNHPNVVQIFELGETESNGQKDYFIAMEFLDGLSLYRAARRSWAANESVPMEVALRAMADAALGLHHAHTLVLNGRPSALVHRDVSPDNIILTRDGISKVLDFGIAKGLDLNDVTGTGEVKGKIPFMSPEQLRGDVLDGRSDLWSLGVTFYWLLTGRRPFDGPNEPMTIDNIMRKAAEPPRTINPLVPPALDAIVMSLLEKDRDKRLASGAVLADQLLALLGPTSSTTAAAAFLARASTLAEPVGPTPISALTVVAARPESQWLKRLGSDATSLQNLIPTFTPTDTLPLPRPTLSTTTEQPTTKETQTGLHTASLVPSARPYAILAGALAAALVGVVAYVLTRAPAPTVSQPTPEPAVASEAPAPKAEPAPTAPAPVVASSPDAPTPTAEGAGGEEAEIASAPVAGDAPRTPPEFATLSPPMIMKIVAFCAHCDPDVASAKLATMTVAQITAWKAAARACLQKCGAVAGGQVEPPPTADEPSRVSTSSRTSRAGTRDAIKASAPARVTWKLGGKVLGKGNATLKVPDGTRAVTAVDGETGGVIEVPVTNGAARFADVKTGTLVVRARPWADVTLGSLALGTTPFDPLTLPAGRYELVFSTDGKTKKLSVDVKPGATANANADMR